MDEDLLNHERSADRRRLPFRVLIAAGLGAFVLGGVAAWYVFGSPSFSTADLFTFRKEQAPLAAETGPPQPAVTNLEPDPRTDERMDQRVAAMEQRLTDIDVQSQAAAGNAARAEGLLIVFSTRRAIERGAPLGYLSDQLQLRFGDAEPLAVQTVIEAANDPVTLDRLIARLDGLAPKLTSAPSADGGWNWISRQLDELFVIRREDSPSPAPERRLERARLFLESGRTEAAVSEVRNLPNADVAATWIADAERYAQTQRALEKLEAAAILEPRELRDGTGKKVEQTSPVLKKSI